MAIRLIALDNTKGVNLCQLDLSSIRHSDNDRDSNWHLDNTMQLTTFGINQLSIEKGLYSQVNLGSFSHGPDQHTQVRRDRDDGSPPDSWLGSF